MLALHRYEVPVDDQWQAISLSGRVVHVDCRNPHVVELWALSGVDTPTVQDFRVFGTGQPLPSEVEHVGTALAPGGQLVWHLMVTT